MDSGKDTQENSSASLNKNVDATNSDTQARLRKQLEEFRAKKQAKKAEAAAEKQAIQAKVEKLRERFSIVPSAIHQKCKEHHHPTPSATTQKTPLHQQHAAQATRVLTAHSVTPQKSNSSTMHVGAPSTAPRHSTSSSRYYSSISSSSNASTTSGSTTQYGALPSKTIKIGKFIDGGIPITVNKPSSSSAGDQPNVQEQRAKTEKTGTGRDTTSSTAYTSMTEISTDSTQIKSIIKKSNIKPLPKLNAAQAATFFRSKVWSVLVDSLAIYIMDSLIHTKCIKILKEWIPKTTDGDLICKQKFLRGTHYFNTLLPMFNGMISLIAQLEYKGIKGTFHTAKYYLYRAAFEEAHGNFGSAADVYESAAQSNAQPSKTVIKAFERFVERIRTMTKEQIAVRPSLAVGVQRLRDEEASKSASLDAAGTTSEDVFQMIGLLDIADVNEDFGVDQWKSDEEQLEVETAPESLEPQAQQEQEDAIEYEQDEFDMDYELNLECRPIWTPSKRPNLVPRDMVRAKLAELEAKKTPLKHGPALRVAPTPEHFLEDSDWNKTFCFSDKENQYEEDEMEDQEKGYSVDGFSSNAENEPIPFDLNESNSKATTEAVSQTISGDDEESNSVLEPPSRLLENLHIAPKTPKQRKQTKETSISTSVEPTTPQVAEEETPNKQNSSEYVSLRKAAYSGAYGSGYIVTPGKGDDTPSRRSRRLAGKK